MMANAPTLQERRPLRLRATDVSQQRFADLNDVPGDATVGEVISGLLSRMSLPRNDTSGRPLTYHARLDREGRHLLASELVGDVLVEDDELVLQPNIDAG